MLSASRREANPASPWAVSDEGCINPGCLVPVAVGFALVVMLLRNTSAAARDLAARPAGVLASSQPLASASLAPSSTLPTLVARRQRLPLPVVAAAAHPTPAPAPAPGHNPHWVAPLLLPLAGLGLATASVFRVLRQQTAPQLSTAVLVRLLAPLPGRPPTAFHMAAAAGKPLIALCPVADGTEDIEFTTVTDVLVRAGITVVTASVMPSKTVTLARGLSLTAQVSIAEVDAKDFDLVVCAGGMPGAEHFRNSNVLNEIVVQMKRDGKLYAAICATPCVMFGNNPEIMQGLRRVTSFPAFHSKLRELHPHLDVSGDTVVVDGNCVTSQGPGTAMAFALKLVELAVGWDTAMEVAKGLLYKL